MSDAKSVYATSEEMRNVTAKEENIRTCEKRRAMVSSISLNALRLVLWGKVETRISGNTTLSVTLKYLDSLSYI